MLPVRVPTFRWNYNPVLGGGLAALATAVIMGVPTDVIPNPWFGRQTPPGTFDTVVLAMLSLLAGALAVTLTLARWSSVRHGAGALRWFATSCSSCNRLVVLLLGATAVTGWFTPIQPILGIAAILLASGALMIRVRQLRRSPVSAGGLEQ